MSVSSVRVVEFGTKVKKSNSKVDDLYHGS